MAQLFGNGHANECRRVFQTTLAAPGPPAKL